MFTRTLRIGALLTSVSPLTLLLSPALASAPQWQLIWQDEFDGPHVDAARWSYEVNCWGGGNNERQCYTPNNATVENGVLHIEARKETYTGPVVHRDSPDYRLDNVRTQSYTSARLRTKHLGDWQYGRFEIRAKLPQGQGVWPAIWMLPSDSIYGPWAASGEIDIMEAVNLGTPSDAKDDGQGKPEVRVHGTLHYGGKAPDNVYTGTGYRLPDNASPADNFHVYAIEWQQGEIRWYVDDVHYATQTQATWYSEPTTAYKPGQDAPFDRPFHLILNLAFGGDWPEATNLNGVDPTALPATFSIDYVRVYRCSDPSDGGAACAQRSPHAKRVTEGPAN
ncbi:glycoside hydrolase family 16 protein [Aestuariibacter halophilus]|uniref:Glycoside hydrolase family 16 protein n=1 Tax=Fluctibacter halophilus TaxID=226011 RepID=A0ABS8GA65_9ALTE|nr:glycoside hydrolase family 16 protein [Aestuariibacter halophilus]MCC2616599.1 glycoside hydrolase family 16 protein [Aestuariibacter halophilus]